MADREAVIGSSPPGSSLRRMRLAARVTQVRLARAAARHRDWVRSVEERERPSQATVERYVSALDKIARDES